MSNTQTKFVSWNIRHGGTKSKLSAICDQLTDWTPDVVGLSEFRESATSQSIAKHLRELGLIHHLTTFDAPDRGRNGLLLASREPLELQPANGRLADLGRWLHVKIQGVDVANMHVPNRSDDKWLCHKEVISCFSELKDNLAIAFGDTNSGKPGLDDENQTFNKREAQWIDQINASGWVDAWREANPQSKDFSWYSHTGNGFRFDQVFATNHLADRITDVQYDWGKGGRTAGLSDHAAVTFSVTNQCAY